MDNLTLRFGDLEAILADLNGIPSQQRTAFQARLKNFHRLGFPEGIGQGRGKAAIYTPREVILMAVAVELTQLGLTPERTIEVITDDEFPVWQCVAMAARAIKERPEVFNPGSGDTGNPPDQKLWGFSPRWADAEHTDPFSMFLYCDPAALAPWTEEGEDRASSTFFYGGAGVLKDNISRWTTGPTRRLAIINVTKLLFDISAYVALENGLKLIDEFEAVANAWITHGDFDLDGWLVNVAKNLGMRVAARPDKSSKWLQLKDLLDSMEDPFGRYVTPVEQESENDALRLVDRTLPDAIIRLPGQRELMVDSKIYPSADIPQEEIEWRLTELAEKPYRTQFTDRTEYIVLYIPSEDYFAGAIAADRTLVDRALEQKVLLATPPVFLKLVAEVDSAWGRYREEFPDQGNEEFAALNPDPRKAATHGDDQKA